MKIKIESSLNKFIVLFKTVINYLDGRSKKQEPIYAIKYYANVFS